MLCLEIMQIQHKCDIKCSIVNRVRSLNCHYPMVRWFDSITLSDRLAIKSASLQKNADAIDSKCSRHRHNAKCCDVWCDVLMMASLSWFVVQSMWFKRKHLNRLSHGCRSIIATKSISRQVSRWNKPLAILVCGQGMQHTTKTTYIQHKLNTTGN